METELKIELPKLSMGIHRFTYVLNMALFEEKGEPLMEHVEGKVHVELNKSTKLIVIDYFMEGKMTLSCDRCLKQYLHSFSFHHKVYYTFEPKMREIEEDDVFFLDRNTQFLELGQDIYDLITLQVPYRKVPDWCPSSQCPEAIMKFLQDTHNFPSSARIDDRWVALKKLNFISGEELGEKAGD